MPRFDARDVEVLYRDADLILIRWQNVMVQYRTGALSAEGLRRVTSTARLLRTRLKGPVGMIGLLSEHAPMPTTETRKQQREVIREMMRDERCYVAAVTTGESMASGLVRTALRLILPGLARVHVATDLPAAVRWLASHLQQSERDLIALAEHTMSIES